MKALGMDLSTVIWVATCISLCFSADASAGVESSTTAAAAGSSPAPAGEPGSDRAREPGSDRAREPASDRAPEPAATVSAELGADARLPCPAAAPNTSTVVWQREGRALADAVPLPDGRLLVGNVTESDAGLYGCRPELGDRPPLYVRLRIQRVPGALALVAVRAHTVLASVSWSVNDTGALPLTAIALRYRAVGQDSDAIWKHALPPHVAPAERMREVYHLRPNTTYEFQLWAENRLGAGPPTILRATTLPDPATQAGVARGLLAEAVVLGSESWVIAVCVSLAAVILVSVGGACFVCRNQRSVPANGDVSESLELVSHLQQPGYELEVLEPEETGGDGHAPHNNNTQRALLLNNNVEVHPVRI